MNPEHSRPSPSSSPSDRGSRSAWRTWGPLLVLWGLGVVTLLAVELYGRASTVYDATALLHVNDSIPSIPVFDGAGKVIGEYRRFLQSQLQIVISPDVLGATLARHPELVRQPLLREAESPESEIRRALRVQIIPETNLFMVSLSSESPTEAQVIVDAVVESYLKVANNRADRDTRARVERLQREVDMLGSKIEARQNQLVEMVKGVGGNIDDEPLRERGRVSLERFNRFLSELDAARMNRIRLEQELEAARQHVNKRKVDGASSEQPSHDHLVVPETIVRKARAREQLDAVGREENDPTCLYDERQAKDLDIKLLVLRKDLAQGDQVDESEREFRRIEAELAAAVDVEEDLRGMLRDAELDGKNRGGKALRIQFAQAELDADMRMQQTLRDHISRLEFESKGPWRVERGAEKTQVDLHTSPRRMTKAGAAILGMMLLSTLYFWLGVWAGRTGMIPAVKRPVSRGPSEEEL